MNHETWYICAGKRLKRWLLYFNVEGGYPLWPKFIEGQGKHENNKEMVFERCSIGNLRQEVHNLFTKLRKRYELLHGNECCDIIEKAVVILNNLSILEDKADVKRKIYFENTEMERVHYEQSKKENYRRAGTEIKKEHIIVKEEIKSAKTPTIVECDTKSFMNVSYRYSLERSITGHLCITFDDNGGAKREN